MQMNEEMNKADEGSKREVQENPILVWEQSRIPQKAAADKVVDMDAYRQLLNTGESEATITRWELFPEPAEQSVKLIMISSGFGKSIHESNSVQGLAA
jgi:hypothetical protein